MWPSLGMFVPHVLFAAPVLNEYLQNACIHINRWIEPFSTVGERGLYLPNPWVPHTTLALPLDNDGLQKAMEVTSKQFSFIAGKVNRLRLVAYKEKPCKEVKTWGLEWFSIVNELEKQIKISEDTFCAARRRTQAGFRPARTTTKRPEN